VAKQIKHFLRKGSFAIRFAFTGEHFVSSLRTTLTIIIPVIVFYRSGYHGIAIDTGLGTLLVGLCDVPGETYKKTRSLLITTTVLALVSLSVCLVSFSPVLLGILLVAFFFSFSMLTVYGGSLSATGSMALIMMIFTMGLHPENGVVFSFYIMLGGLWYTVSAAIYAHLFPYRPIRQAIRECIVEVSDFLRIKGCFYDTELPLTECYEKLIPRHVRVNEKQDALRAILLTERFVFYDRNEKARRLLKLAEEVIDLYEQILATHYDYSYIREKLGDIDVLKTINRLVLIMADDLGELGNAMHSRRKRHHSTERVQLLTELLENAAAISAGLDAKLIDKIVENLVVINDKIKVIGELIFNTGRAEMGMSDQEAIRFVSSQPVTLKQLQQHLTIKSLFFRFSLRVTITCLCAYLAILFFLPGQYSYWLLLTIVIVARPNFASTRRRNFQRVTGTLIGIAGSFIVLKIVDQPYPLITLVILFLLGYLTFLYINYLISVIFITGVAIIGIHLLGANAYDLITQRGYETLMGCAAALTTAFLFPFWESRKLKDLAGQLLSANIKYLEYLRNFVANRSFDPVDYKLARKQVFISSANFSKAYNHILTEPATNRAEIDMLYQFQVFNHELYASVAGVLMESGIGSHDPDRAGHIETVERSIAYLNNGLKIINGTASLPVCDARVEDEVKPIEGTTHKVMLRQQLQLIADLSKNIYLQSNKIKFK